MNKQDNSRIDAQAHSKIPKEKVGIVALTEQFRIEGTTHYVPQARLSDLMNRPDVPFLPVTDASVYTHEGALVMQAAFVSLNKSRIVLITTIEADEAHRER